MAALSCSWTRTNRWSPEASAQPTATSTIRSYGSGTTRRHKNGIRRTSASRGSSPAFFTGMSRPEYCDVDVTSRGNDAADDRRPGEVEFMNTGRDSNHAAVTRRTFLGAAVASAALATGSALAQQPAPAPPAPRVKGPAVWLDMDQAELDAAYDQGKYAPNLPQIVKRYATNSDAVRARLGAPTRYAYGSTPIEALDVYATKRANAPINIFFHGGAWRGGLAKDSAYPAELFVHAGGPHLVPAFFYMLEDNSGPLPLTAEARRAVGWVYRNAQSFGGDPNRIYVSGHSSGG